MSSQREADLERRLEAAETVIAALRLDRTHIGDNDEELLRSIADTYRALALAGDPMTSRSELTGSRGRGAEPAFPGAATAYARRIKARLNRALNRAVADVHTQLDGEWQPPPRCSSCGRSMRYTDRWCGRCGARVGPKAQPQEGKGNAGDKPAERVRSRPTVEE